jgi:hypothetical protein
MAHTKASIAKMLASRAANRAKKAKGNGHAKSARARNGNGHAAPHVRAAVDALTEYARALPKDPLALTDNDLRALAALKYLAPNAPSPG